MIKKICSKCKEEKEVCEFNVDKTKTCGYYSSCKECCKKYEKLRYIKNREKIIQKQKIYQKNTPEKRSIIIKKYKNKNKEKIREYDRNYDKIKKSNDPIYKLKKNLRRRIKSFFDSKNVLKNNTTFKIVGCSPEFLKEYIEKQFSEGMSWELMGQHIHIDHIIPLSSAKTEEEIYKLCHYTNLQPLWAEDNLKKSDKILL
jgi:hypothetical protein